jgi:galactonate dehydratase
MTTSRMIVDVRTWSVGTSWRNLVFVEVETDDGIVGLGEATVEWFEEAVEAHVRSVGRRHALGRDPFDVQRLVADVLRNDYWPTNVVLNSALAGIELACWDIMGQALDEPVYRLLGGACREVVPCYANGWYRVPREPEAFARAAAATTVAGATRLKLDPFGAGHMHLDEDELRGAAAIVGAVREAVGPDVDLFVDAHGRFTTESALRAARELAPHRISFLEEPVPPESLAALQRVTSAAGVPIAAGERAFSPAQADAVLAAGVDVLQPDPIHCGGLIQTRHIAALADHRAVPVALHDSNGPVATSACLHLNAVLPNALVQEVFDECEEPWIRDLVPGAPRPRRGQLELPDAPGLGVRLDHTVAAAHPAVQLDFHHWQDGWERRGAEPVPVATAPERKATT